MAKQERPLRRDWTAAHVVEGRDIAIEIVPFDREQNFVGRAPFKS